MQKLFLLLTFTLLLNLVQAQNLSIISKAKSNQNDFCMENPCLSLIPADIENYYKKYGFDDAKTDECRIAGDYSQCIIDGMDYYIPWVTLQPNVSADFKLDLNLSEEMFVSHRLQSNFFITDSSPATVISDTALYFVIKPNDSTKLPIKINGLDSLVVRFSEIDDTISLSSKSVGTGFVDIYSVLNGNRKLSGRIEIDCREMKRVGDIQFVSVNNYPVGDVFARLDSINKYLVQAGVCFSLANPYEIHIGVDLSTSRNYLESFKQRIVQGGYNDGPTYIFFNSYGYAGRNRGNSYLPQKPTNSGWLEVKTDDSIVLVHELIHTMGLNHVFDYCKGDYYNDSALLFSQKRNIPKYSTNNIMDYSKEIIDARRLLMKYQINHIYNTFANYKLSQK